MKIAVIAPEVFPVPPVRGGAVETIIERVTEPLRSHAVAILSVADTGLPLRQQLGHRVYERWQPNPFNQLCLASWRLPFKQIESVWYYHPYVRWAIRRLRTFKPDLIWLHSRMPFLPWLRAAFPQIPIILSLHNESNLRGAALWQPAFVSAADCITTCSQSLADTVARHYPHTQPYLRVLYNGVATGQFTPRWNQWSQQDRDPSAPLRAEYGLSNHPLVLYVGRLVESKGVHVLLDAWPVVRRHIPQAQLCIAGAHTFSDGSQTQYIRGLRAKAAEFGGVHFLGHVDHQRLPALLAMSDVLAFPSTWQEPFGMVVVEAMASGLPVVAFRQGGPAEIIEHERSGLLVEPQQGSEGLARALVQLLQDKQQAERIAFAAREQVVKRFEWSVIARDFERLCEAWYCRVHPGPVGAVPLPSTADLVRSIWHAAMPAALPAEGATLHAAHRAQPRSARILIAESGSGFGGTARYLYDLLKSVSGDYTFCVVAAGNGPLIRKVAELGVSVSLQPLWRFPWCVAAQPAVARRLPQHPMLQALLSYIDLILCGGLQVLMLVPLIALWLKRRAVSLVHLNNELLSHLPLLMAARLAGCKVVCHLHGWRALTRLERLVHRWVHQYVCISVAGAEHYRAQLGSLPVVPIVNGIDLKQLPNQEQVQERRVRLRSALGIEDGAILMVCVGRFEPWKGQDVFLQALALVVQAHPQVRGLLVGRDADPARSYELRLRKQARALGLDARLSWLDWQDDIWSVYAAADVLVHASKQPEPFGLVLVEAMALGRPVIATRAGGVLDIITDGETGRLVAPGNVADLAAAMQEHVAQPQRVNPWTCQARAVVRQRFAIEHNAQQVLAIYAKLLNPC
jgi:glycosyltransferase involved in cell wall biosynthesis